jgi:hypothetical protein
VDWLSLPDPAPTLRSRADLRELEELVLGFRAVIRPIQRPTTITPTDTTCGRITAILSRIRTVIEALHTPGITGAGVITVTIVIIITAIDRLQKSICDEHEYPESPGRDD